jgi:O-antigen ligase
VRASAVVRPRLPAGPIAWGQVAVAGMGAAAFGLLLGRGELWTIIGASVAVAICLGAVAIFWLEASRPGYLSVEIPVFLLVFGNINLRPIFTGKAEFATSALEPFALLHLVCVSAALALGMLALLSPPHPDADPLTSRPIRLYVCYACVVLAGIATSVFPIYTAFRGVEVLAGLVVVTGAFRRAGIEGLRRIERMLYWYFVLRLGSVWLSVLLFPGLAIETINSPIPIRIQGVIPPIGYDGVGFLSVVLVMWSLGRLLDRAQDRPRPFITKLIAVVAFITLLGAQYRTGYAALAFALAVLMVLRGRAALAALSVVGLIVISVWGSTLVETAQPYALRGQTTEQAARLQGRVSFWATALPVWQRSPIIGGGLQTASRFEALAQIEKRSGISPNNVHSSWVEALVGTGVVGVFFLGLCFLTTVGRSVKRALLGFRIVPALLMSVLVVRGITAGGLEQGGDTSLLFLVLALGLRDVPSQRDHEDRARAQEPTPGEVAAENLSS